MSGEPREPDDVLDALARAFRELPAPPPARELDAEDEATRRAVAWMAAAFRAQSPASSAPPAAILARTAQPAPRERRIWRPLAAAAAVLVLLGGALLLADHVLHPRAAMLPVAPVAQAPETGIPGPDTTPPEITPPAAPASGVVAVAEDHLELRSGPVRMLLFLNAPPSSREDLR